MTQEEFDALTDEDIGFFDAPQAKDKFWASAVVVSPVGKERLMY